LFNIVFAFSVSIFCKNNLPDKLSIANLVDIIESFSFAGSFPDFSILSNIFLNLSVTT
jgi:hypothetical protein